MIKYNGELTSQTADMLTSKILCNSVISTKDARYVGFDIKNFCLGTTMKEYEYMRMPMMFFPRHIIQQYNLRKHAKNEYVYVEIRKAIYGLP